MSTAYDISHRRTDPPQPARIPDLPPSVDPSLVTIHPPRGKFWVAQCRKDAQLLREQLSQMEKAADLEVANVDSEFEVQTLHLERLLHAHTQTLDSFIALAEASTPERGPILRRISAFYKTLAEEIPRLKGDFAAKFGVTEGAAHDASRREQELQAQCASAQSAIERQTRAIDSLKQQINEHRLRCSGAEDQLRDAANDKGAMSRASQTNQLKLTELTREIKDKRDELEKLRALVETLKLDHGRRTQEISQATADLTALRQEGDRLDAKRGKLRARIAEQQQVCEQLRRTPLRTVPVGGRGSVAVQAHRLPRGEARPRVAVAQPSGGEIAGQEQFLQIKSDMELVQGAIPSAQLAEGRIVIRTVDDLRHVRTLILQNNRMFDYSVGAISRVHRGAFTIDDCPPDEARIYAGWVMRRIMRGAVAARLLVAAEVQTDEVETIRDAGETEGDDERKRSQMFRAAPKSLYYLIKQSRFIALLAGSDYAARVPRAFDWVIRAIRSIFDEKTVDDRTNARDGAPIVDLPEYILVWAARQFSSDVRDLAVKGCWDLFISAHHHMQKELEVMLFVRFLDEMWTTELLSFYLAGRTWALRRCVSVPMEHPALAQYFTETFMTKRQVDEFFHAFFPATEEELVADLVVRGCACSDPGRGDEDEAACVPLQRVLELAVGEKADEKVRRIRKMLAFYKLVPRMTAKRFALYIKALLPSIDATSIDSLYRSSLTPNKLRTEMNVADFREFYGAGGPVVPAGWGATVITYAEFAHHSDIFAMVLNRWSKFEPFLRRMIDVMHRQPHEDTKIVVNEIRHHRFLLLEAKLSFDGILFYQNYHGVLQTILRACFKMGSPEAFLFRKQIGDLQQIALRKFDSVVDARSGSSRASAAPEEERGNGEEDGDASDSEDEDAANAKMRKDAHLLAVRALPSPPMEAEGSTSEDEDLESAISSGEAEMADDEISGEDSPGVPEGEAGQADERRSDPIVESLENEAEGMEEDEGEDREPTEDTEEYQPRREEDGI